MASETQETLYRIFEALSGGLAGVVPQGREEAAGQATDQANRVGPGAQILGSPAAVTADSPIAGAVADALTGTVVRAAGDSGSVAGTVARAVESAVGGGIANVLGSGGGLAGAIESAVSGSGSNGKSSGGGVGDVALSVLKSGLGVMPLASLIFGLFGGDDKEQPPALTKYALPARRSFEAANTAFGLADVDYDQSGRPRVVDGRSGAASSAPQITVNVQAMDARSFLDRSGDIAAAVREAMLNLNSINDVVTDL